MFSLASSSSSQSKPKLTFEYDVFFTFDGLANRLRIFLENCLRDAGMKTYVHDMVRDYSRWEMIESCRIVMVVITPEFVASDICLDGLEKIMSDPKTVLPLFYGVSHNEFHMQFESFYVRKLRSEGIPDGVNLSELSKAYRLRLRKFGDSIFDWNSQRRADAECSSLYGFTLSHDFGDQEVVHNLIAKSISQVGVQSRVKEVLRRLGWESHSEESTTIVGIVGVGGIGKTTIARAIYDSIGGHFNCKSFLANIKDVWKNKNGKVLLQKQLLSDIHVKPIDQGSYRRALIVLDDVDQASQLIKLSGNIEQFGKGSLIFITTRNKDLLDDFVDISYEVEKLGERESLELFGWHAFKNFGPTNDIVDLSMKVITLCEGLPLFLEVIGSLLHNKTKSEWIKILNKLKKVSGGQIQHKLKISVDFLADSEKKLFCDIAHFYVGRSKSYVINLFKSSRFPLLAKNSSRFPLLAKKSYRKLPIEMAMQVLIERSLVKVINDKIHVHDLLQEIGREIAPTNKQNFVHTYDVFLSFRGADTRKSFATHLYNALKQAGIEVFMDEERIERGEQVSGSLLQAIENSRISIIIFSENYADSNWCLQELEKIMECYKTTDHEVFPIFYDVQPSDVRKQQNAFGKAWERLITRPSSSKGKKSTNNLKRVLAEVANLSGWHTQNYRTEAELLDDVVKTITMRIDNRKYIFVAHHPVGLESRVQDIIQFLSESNGITIIGIWGMGGIGKTTMAKTIYNEMRQSFVGKSFLANIREVWKQDNGQVYLQGQLLSSILRTRRINLLNVGIGKSIIKQSLCQKRVFLVLDDVDNED